MTNLTIILAALALLAWLLFLEKREEGTLRLIVKVALSFLFIVAAVTQSHLLYGYYKWLLTGLILCLVGDALLAVPQSRAFQGGLFAFLAGHVFYILAFGAVTPASGWFGMQSLPVLAVSVGIFIWLRPHVGDMLVPVILYITVITLMIIGASGVLLGSGVESGGMIVAVGAICFYLSDIFVARDRFVRKEFLNRALGLPLYYCGQFLLAFSVEFLK